MANAETAPSRSGWGGHIWSVVLAFVMGGQAPYIFAAALGLGYSFGEPTKSPISEYLFTILLLAKAFSFALSSLFWSGIISWFVGCTMWFRHQRLPWFLWLAWGAVTMAVTYVIGVVLLFPKSEIGRHTIMVSDPFSVDTAVGIAFSAVSGAIAGVLLFALTPRWPGSPLKSSGSN